MTHSAHLHLRSLGSKAAFQHTAALGVYICGHFFFVSICNGRHIPRPTGHGKRLTLRGSSPPTFDIMSSLYHIKGADVLCKKV